MAGDSESNQREPKRSTCPNCTAPSVGQYCTACGQNNRVDRLSVKEMFGTAFEHMLELDVPIIRTVIALSTRPGAMCREYVHGKRRQYSNPFRYCLITAALYVLTLAVLDISPSERFQAFPPPSATVIAEDGTVAPAPRSQRVQSYIQTNAPLVVENNVNFFAFMAIPIATPAFLLLFIRSRYTYAEHLVFAFFAFGHGFLYTALLVPLGLLSTWYTALASYFIDVAYLTWAGVVFYRTGVVTTALRMAFAHLCYMLSIGVVGTIVIVAWVAWLFATGEILNRI